jgi:hypothetical protein
MVRFRMKSEVNVLGAGGNEKRDIPLYAYFRTNPTESKREIIRRLVHNHIKSSSSRPSSPS